MEEEDRISIGGVAVRAEDVEPERGLRTMAWVFRGSATVIFLLALYQFVAWWLDPPPGGVGTGVLVGDTIRLIVFAALLWAAGNIAILLIKTHHDIRAARILLARQTHLMQKDGAPEDATAAEGSDGRDRRAHGT